MTRGTRQAIPQAIRRAVWHGRERGWQTGRHETGLPSAAPGR